MGSKKDKPELIVKGKRTDGRAFDELRPIKIEVGMLKNAEGSAYMEWGNNRVLAAIYGPKEAQPKHFADPERAIIKCRYQMAPFSSLEEHSRSGPNRRAIEISKVTREVFENVILLDNFPGDEIDIFVEILQSDGGTRAAGITAAALAVASSGIPMRDIPYAVSAGKVGEEIILDLNKLEDNYSDADMPIAIAPRNNDVLLLQMDGSFSKAQLAKALEMSKKAGEVIVQKQREALEALYK